MPINCPIVKDGLLSLKEGTPSWQMLHTGDLCPIDAYEQPFRSGAIEPILSDFIALGTTHDYVMTNLETPISRNGAPILKGGPNFRIDPELLNGLQKLKLTHACLANNHIKDYGPDPIADTMAHLQASGIMPLGVINRFEGVADPTYIEQKDVRVAIFNVAEAEYAYPRNGEFGASCLNEGELILKIQAAKQSANAIIVRAHAGREYALFPATWLRKLYQRLIDAGANAIIADHPHVPQGIERHKNGLIFYSLGNFVFDFSDSPQLIATRIGYALSCAFSKDGLLSVRILPYHQKPDFSVRIIEPSAQHGAFLSFLDKLSAPLAEQTTADAVWDEYVRKEGPRYMEGLKTTLSVFPDNDPLKQRTLFKSLSGAINSCRTHLEVRRAYIRLGYEDRIESDPAAAMIINAAKSELANLLKTLEPTS